MKSRILGLAPWMVTGAVVAAVGCKSPDPPSAEACSADTDCAENFVCEDGRCVVDTTIPQDTDVPDTTPSPVEGDADFGDPCKKSEDCKGTMECFLTPSNGRVCTVVCDGGDADYECPDPQWECTAFSGGGTDLSHICLPPPPSLCKSCDDDLDCGASGKNLCLTQSDGDFCGIACTSDTNCPTDYECLEILRNEEVYHQCVPTSGRCIDCVDMDGDGFGVAGANSECTYPLQDDCDDTDPQRFPGSTHRICDGFATDCGPIVDVHFVNEDDVYNHVEHCGTCGNACYGPHVAAAECAVSGLVAECVILACDEGWADCDGNPANGCEADLSRTSTCGACDVSCGGSSASTASSLCVDQGGSRFACEVTCNPNYSDCNGIPNDGCEADLRNPSFCGSCGNDCDAVVQNGEASCHQGACGILRCDDGWADCDGDPLNGCETDLSDEQSCGGCGVICGSAGTNPEVESECRMAPGSSVYACRIVCADGMANCNGIPNDGCEVNIKNGDTANCGSCGGSCEYANAATSCVASQCRFDGCDPSYGDCDGDMLAVGANQLPGLGLTGCEVRLDDNDDHCGACGNSCASMPGEWMCEVDTCEVRNCPGDTLDCDNDASVCESNRNDPTTCGNCSTNCLAKPHVTAATCSPDSTVKCTITGCDAGYKDCNGQHTDGCEIATLSDVNNCGACGNRCELPHATMECAGGQCSFVACEPGWMHLEGLEASEGCTYQCTPSPGDDRPDDFTVTGYSWQSKDSNCDGIDGDPLRALFVDTLSGNDNNPGTMARPLKTISAALAALGGTSTNMDQIYVSEGTYTEALTLVKGVSIYGGFKAADGWSRNPSYKVQVQWNAANAQGHVVAVQGADLTGTARTVLQNIEIQAGPATSVVPGTLQGASSIGIQCATCPSLSVVGAIVRSGAGAAGANGVHVGQTPSLTAAQTEACTGKKGDDNEHRTVDGGPGGAALWCAPGRAGGRGGQGTQGDGQPGQNGMISGAGGGAGGGSVGRKTDGKPGGNGAVGGSGAAGAGATAEGSLMHGGWYGQSGLKGSDGQPGHGGGGAGGGGGEKRTLAANRGGGGGGGGGAGGCPGSGGDGGGAGGASITLQLSSSTGAIIQTTRLLPSAGGAGGAGRVGGAGLDGCSGGNGGAGYGASGDGGKGGTGGKGGKGGAGGGGAGGPSFGLLLQGSTLTGIPGSNTIVPLSGGAGGPGPEGTSGTAGLSSNVHSL